MPTTPDVDPRIQRTRRLVLDATTQLIGEVGFGRTTIEAVSERSGVARSTIYRHWPSRPALLMESVGKSVESIETPDTGDLRTDLRQNFSHLCSLLSDQSRKAVFASFLSESTRDEQLGEMKRRFTWARRKSCSEVIDHAIDRGELPSGTDSLQMTDDLASGIYFRALIIDEVPDGEWLVEHIDRWIATYSK
ncbi:MAG: TetR/AcrR family transcriptional regulator [Acidimicrobiia bacterium]